jgi:bifunctional non-homologous end joining protein LigD
MLASLVDKPFDRSGWFFEVKWDGYRAIAEVDRKSVSLYSRNHKSFVDRFAPLVESLRHLGHEAVLDGEVVVLDEAGKASFQLLQNYQKTGEGRLCYYVFDLLYLDGHDLRMEPLRRRKELLVPILGTAPDLLLSEHVEEHGITLFEAANARDLEGIMAKDADSPYREGRRSQEWLKIKTRRRQEAVICGYTEPRGSRYKLGALVLGVHDGKGFSYIGHTGGGLDTKGLSDLRGRLEPLERKTCPFAVVPHTNAPVHWVTPRLVCEVVFQEWTQDGHMRQPIFVGLREDKRAEQVRRELEQPIADAVQQEERASGKRTRRFSPRRGTTLAPLGRSPPKARST